MEQAHQPLVQINVQPEHIVLQVLQVVQLVELENGVQREVQHVVI